MYKPTRGPTGARRLLRPLAFAVALPMLSACAGLGASGSNAVGSDAAFAGWSAYLGSASSSQFSSLAQIDKSNVAQLQLAWTYETGEGPAPRLNPLVVNGVMYVVAQKGAIVALDPATGKELWRRPNQGAVGDRGLSYWQSAEGKDRRLLYVNAGMLTAISAEDGHPITSFGTDGKVDLRVGIKGDISKVRPLQTDNPGRVYKDLIIMSLPAGAYEYASAPADLHAYDVRTGKLVWVFHTVPEKGEYGYNTWPEKDHDLFGGVHNWSESTLDEERGVLYVPTGTARYDFYGGNRAGNNLFADSVVALDARTGKRLWHFQAVHHDLWDYDFPQAPKLLTIHKDGRDIPIVIQASKQGFVYVFDRRDGRPIWPIEERPVPASDVPGEKASPTQPFPTWPKPFARQTFTEADINPYIPEADREKVRQLFRTSRNEGIFTPPSVRGTIQMPGHNGGANWGTSAVDPTRQRFFVMAKNLPVYTKLTVDKRPQAQAAVPNGGGEVQPYKAPVDFMIQSNSLGAIAPPWSTITAYDMNTGKILWQVPDGEVAPLAAQGIRDTGSHAPRGAPVATKSGLLFIGTSSDRKFRARDADTGKVLWEVELPAASEGVPAIYEAGGREFVVIPVGGVGLFTSAPGMSRPGPNQYMAFALPAPGAR